MCWQHSLLIGSASSQECNQSDVARVADEADLSVAVSFLWVAFLGKFVITKDSVQGVGHFFCLPDLVADCRYSSHYFSVSLDQFCLDVVNFS